MHDVTKNFDHDEPMFALLDPEFFKQGPVDFIEKKNQLEALDNYESFSVLIDSHLMSTE